MVYTEVKNKIHMRGKNIIHIRGKNIIHNIEQISDNECII